MVSTLTLPLPTRLSVADLVLRARQGVLTDGGCVDRATFLEVLGHLAEAGDSAQFRCWVFDDLSFQIPNGMTVAFNQCHWFGPLVVNGHGPAGLSFMHCRFETEASFYGLELELPLEFAYCEFLGPFDLGPPLSGQSWRFPSLIAEETVFHSLGQLRLENLDAIRGHERIEFRGCELRHAVTISAGGPRFAGTHSPGSRIASGMAVEFEHSVIEPGGAFQIDDPVGFVREISLRESHIDGEVRFEFPDVAELARLPISLVSSSIQGRLVCRNRLVQLDLQDAKIHAGCIELSFDSPNSGSRRKWVLLEPVQELSDRLRRPTSLEALSERHTSAAEQYELLAHSLAASEFDNDRDHYHYLSQSHRLKSRIHQRGWWPVHISAALLRATIVLIVFMSVFMPPLTLSQSLGSGLDHNGDILSQSKHACILSAYAGLVSAGWFAMVYGIIALRSDAFGRTHPLVNHDSVMREVRASPARWNRFWGALTTAFSVVFLHHAFGHGRRLGRFLVSNLLIIVIFAGVYWAMSYSNPKAGEVLIETGTNGPQVNYATGSPPADEDRKAGSHASTVGSGNISFGLADVAINSFYFSTMKFCSADTDDMHPHGRLRLAVMLESLTGIFMTAMLVTLLARRYLRLG